MLAIALLFERPIILGCCGSLARDKERLPPQMSALSKVCAVRDHHDDALRRFWLTILKTKSTATLLM